MSSVPPQTRKWGTDTYSKFDSITDLDSETLQSVTSTNFTLGSPPPPPPNLVDVMYASEKLKKRVLNVEKNNGVWAVDVLPLRLWSASVETGMEGRPYPVQPLTILLSTLYPKGQLLTYKINTLPSPESPPSNENVIELVINQILNPDYSPSYKPTKLVFTDSILYHELSHTIRGLDIEPCYVETHANGLIEYVETISKRLKKEGVGDYDEDCFEKEKLGFKGVPYFYETYKEILEKKIWEGFSVRQSFKMVTKDRTFYCCCLGSDGIYGLALFYSKLDLCTRFESAVSTLWKKSDRCFVNGKKGKRLKPRMYDVRSGEEVCFEGVEQQKKAWKGNKRFFRKYEDFEKGVETGRIFWGDGEASVIFKDCLHVSFKELDSIQKENYAVVNDRGCEAAGSEGVVYPIPVAIKSGQMKDVDERTFDDLIVAGGVFNSLERDSKLKEKLLDIKFEKNWEGIVEPQFETYGVEVDVGNGDVEKVDVTFDPVWTKSEVSGVLEQVAKKVEEGKKEEEQEEEEQVRVVQEAMDEAKIDDVKVGVGGEGEGGEGGVRDTESSELRGAGCVVA
ncbi:hypothetical protein TrLO_g9312 [Triparma laevis f. longispina]|uniref:Uncharacterized protein n=1 Tax=Triparma laevis f. longispina TaxID=1714387 RepID=A0A9W7FEX3_9STRA|nr:hypothetical protein TrLO_g9312 [Triparma laevis f. longispina]